MKKICIFISLVFLNLNFQSLKADEMYDLGKNVFLNKANCSSCHVLDDANSQGQIGPNLDKIKPELIRVLNVVSMGIGVMPAFEGILTDEEIKSVSYYVFKSTNK